MDTQISIVDIADCVEGHLLGAERGVPGERYVLNGATLSSLEALEIVAGCVGRPASTCAFCRRAWPPPRRRSRRPPSGCAAASRRSAARWCARSLHGHRYDGARAERELGLRYTPVAETFRRTIEWATREGLVESGGVARPQSG